MSAINTKIKTIILTAISAAILSACGGGGGDTAALSTGSTSTGGNGSPAKNGSPNNATPSAANKNNGNTVAAATPSHNRADNLADLIDEAPIEAVNGTTPLHTSFISSATAQQGNPNAQLRLTRTADGKEYTGDFYLTDSKENNQNGLISSLDFKNNDEVKLDGVVIANKNAAQVNWTTPYSLIMKVFSGGNTKSDGGPQNGKIDGDSKNFINGRASIDEKITELYTQIETAKETLKQAKEQGDVDAIAKAQAKLDELNDLDGRLRDIRPVIAAGAKNLADKLAYFRKGNLVAGDGKHLVFDKRFDGVYIIQFTDGTQIVMHDPAAAGWAYQTFAYYFDPKNDVAFGYQSLGDETKFTDLPEKGTATYNGLTTAYVVKGDQGRQLTADVKAIVDFGLKGVRFETSNSQFHSLDDNGRRVTVKGTDYDMKGTAKWENGNLFLGSVEAAAAGLKGNLSGKFYGAKAAEIGGTYGLKNQDGSEHLIGGYGAKRQ
ncbi:transferrin-binding protein-like solute binding protein [Neisseria sicca]|uniref:transferrin-binding protein-like solute binding protein n=1 Tax=Neisseria sicca TaxID=490 RepID=UPI003C76EF5E